MKFGWLNIDKPCGMSSGKVVHKVKKMLGVKAGHAGTLDPLATGVLPIAFGEATKTTMYATDTVKVYEVTVKWGEQRDTDDAEGEVVCSSSVRPDEQSIRDAIQGYIGVVQQVPATFSAIRVGGTRAYSLSRKGKDIELAPRSVCILSIEFVSMDRERGTADFVVTCKKGVYIRALARDLGITLGCLGYVLKLRRTRVGPFTEHGALTLQRLEELSAEGRVSEAVLPINIFMDGITNIEVDESVGNSIRNGRSIRLRDIASNGLCVEENYDMCYLSQAGGVPVAVCAVVDGTARPVRVFNV
ncbi:tRNA pseudouridine(55) synthase TruB [Candidatus Anaplasma sp. TIGMIC]|uniref:tRNA pseudouridine(55) synthase TruB n=1 Tax=Candidatus Anaplasma sp. TIGMIC TaxID=3020713 RepID=UPI00232B9131|nr:tRNA pseudouridine(55) synthase TruB [Candidatus Anaplasma sp. TIGMIC]MDB1135666.1 tRNA pseudouridine(55) synthase TruB [Candidatus Anaplasma sp. TIGMIC]